MVLTDVSLPICSSRSRSRSRSPGYRNYPPRDYQGNNRGFRGYNRGYRRPYHYRGRNRGYYPRGNYQNRGRGGGGYGYKSNWQGGGGGWHDRQDRQDHHSPRRAYSRSRTPKKRSASRSRSRYSDRSSSGRSRQSRHSSYSSRSRSRSSSRHRESKGRTRSKEVKDKQPESQPEKSSPPAVGSVIAKTSGGKWIDYEGSPKRRSPDSKKEVAPAPESKGGGSSGSSGSVGSGGPMWKTVGSVSPPAKSPSKSGQTASFSGFGFFSKEEAGAAGDSTVISAAVKKYVLLSNAPTVPNASSMPHLSSPFQVLDRETAQKAVS